MLAHARIPETTFIFQLEPIFIDVKNMYDHQDSNLALWNTILKTQLDMAKLGDKRRTSLFKLIPPRLAPSIAWTKGTDFCNAQHQ